MPVSEVFVGLEEVPIVNIRSTLGKLGDIVHSLVVLFNGSLPLQVPYGVLLVGMVPSGEVNGFSDDHIKYNVLFIVNDFEASVDS